MGPSSRSSAIIVTSPIRRVLARARSRLLVRSLVAAAVVTLAPAASATTTLRAEYSIVYTGLTVARAVTTSTIETAAYQSRIELRVNALGFGSGFNLDLYARGAINRSAIQPVSFASSQTNSDQPRSRRIDLVGDTVKSIEILPPPEDLERRVPLRDEHKKHVVDPASVLVMSAPASELGPSTCNRTLRLFDGVTRTDYELLFVRIEDAKVPGYRGAVAVCSVRYIPIAGHDPTSATTKFMQSNAGIEVRLAAPPEIPHLLVVAATVPLQVGTVSLRIEKLQVDQTATSPGR